MSTGNEIESILTGFKSISLEEVAQASLMRRKDIKFVFSSRHVPFLLREVSGYYRVLDVKGKRDQSYQTLYYDTGALDMYKLHHSGRVNRHKIRFRKYGSSSGIFFEVKSKNSRGITIKNRMQSAAGDPAILSREEEFLSQYTPYEEAEIIPVLENSFNRITLVSPGQDERITLDHSLWFRNRLSGKEMDAHGMAIAEIKYGNHLAASPFRGALRKARVIPRRFSKYCIGMAMLDPGLKQNLFKEKIRLVRKIIDEYEQHINAISCVNS